MVRRELFVLKIIDLNISKFLKLKDPTIAPPGIKGSLGQSQNLPMDSR